jgi:hypothetical protein
MGFFSQLANVVAPFHIIAKELTALRELYEAELASREKPVYRITESPGRNDTEVTYGDEDKEKSPLRRLMEGMSPELDDD